MTTNKVNFQNSNNDEIVCLITKLEENNKVNGFTISFRMYNVTQEIGGFETTLWVANASINCAKMFCGSLYEAKQAAQIVGATINSKKVDNNVPVKFQYNSIKKQLA